MALLPLVDRARSKARIELAFAAHRAGAWYARRTTNVRETASAQQQAADLRRNGYAVLPPTDRIREFVSTDYQRGMLEAWNTKQGVWRDPPTGGTYKVFLSDVCERWPLSLSLLDDGPGEMLRAYYGAHFQFTYVEPYRTFPAEGELPKSWLWHYDAVPPGVLKLMVYLNGATADTGALRVVDHANSREIEKRGYRTRADSDKLAEEFDARSVVCDGGPGTSVIIDNRVLHKATAPSHGFRDVICFQIVPSLVPEHEARARSGRSRSYAAATPQYPLLPPLR
jgi:hypothetical protein